MIITKHLRPNWFPAVRHGVTHLLDLILPPRCPVTGELVGVQGTLHPSFWLTLNFIREPLCKSCGTPFPHETAEGMICTSCLQTPPAYQSARHVWRYDDASAALILKFKHGDALHLAPMLGRFLAQAGGDLLPAIDLLVPVPLHRFRLLKRRYNQAALLGRILARESGLPQAPHLLQRRRATESQGRKSHAERHSNLKDAFVIPPEKIPSLSGKRVLLIDDVYTSGATANECARTLLAAGAASVDLLCLAKVVKD